MNGYLVLARCSLDDIPLRLCGSREEAAEYAQGIGKREVREQAAVVCGVGVSDVHALDVVRFVDGVPLPFQSLPWDEED
jgi:hypothetical protein